MRTLSGYTQMCKNVIENLTTSVEQSPLPSPILSSTMTANNTHTATQHPFNLSVNVPVSVSCDDSIPSSNTTQRVVLEDDLMKHVGEIDAFVTMLLGREQRRAHGRVRSSSGLSNTMLSTVAPSIPISGDDLTRRDAELEILRLTANSSLSGDRGNATADDVLKATSSRRVRRLSLNGRPIAGLTLDVTDGQSDTERNNDDIGMNGSIMLRRPMSTMSGGGSVNSGQQRRPWSASTRLHTPATTKGYTGRRFTAMRPSDS